MRIVRLALCLCGVFAAAPAAAQAAGWLEPVQMSEVGVNSTDTRIAATPQGDLAIAYRRAVPSTNARVAVRLRPAGGVFAGEQLVSGAAETPSTAEIGAGANGTVALAWPSGGDVVIARRSPGAATFTTLPAFDIASETAVSVFPPVVLPGGETVVAFLTFVSPSNQRIRAIRVGPGDAAASALAGTQTAGSIADLVSAPDASSFVTLGSAAGDGDGRVYVSWFRSTTTTTPSFMTSASAQVAIRAAGGNFAAPVTLGFASAPSSTFGRIGVPAVASGPGAVFAAWGESDGAAVRQIRFRELTGGAAASDTTNVPTTGFVGSSRLAIDRTGALVAAWAESSSLFAQPTHIRGLIRPPAAAFPAPGVLADPGVTVTLGDLVTGPAGDAVLAWEGGGGGSSVSLHTQYRLPGGPFGAPESVVAPFDSTVSPPPAVIDANGLAHVAWSEIDDPEGTARRAVFAVRDGIAPAIDAMTLPANATTGAPLAFTSRVSDALSPVTATWDFGDGSTASGMNVSHAFGVAGSYTIKLTATDAAGNATERVATLTIADATGVTDRQAPVASRFSLSRKRFGIARGSTATIAARRAPKGTRFRVTLSERATVVIELARRVGKRTRSAGTLVRGGRGPGAIEIPFSGRVGRKALARGRYRATLVAIDAAGNRSKAVRATFTVAR